MWPPAEQGSAAARPGGGGVQTAARSGVYSLRQNPPFPRAALSAHVDRYSAGREANTRFPVRSSLRGIRRPVGMRPGRPSPESVRTACGGRPRSLTVGSRNMCALRVLVRLLHQSRCGQRKPCRAGLLPGAAGLGGCGRGHSRLPGQVQTEGHPGPATRDLVPAMKESHGLFGGPPFPPRGTAVSSRPLSPGALGLFVMHGVVEAGPALGERVRELRELRELEPRLGKLPHLLRSRGASRERHSLAPHHWWCGRRRDVKGV